MGWEVGLGLEVTALLGGLQYGVEDLVKDDRVELGRVGLGGHRKAKNTEGRGTGGLVQSVHLLGKLLDLLVLLGDVGSQGRVLHDEGFHGVVHGFHGKVKGFHCAVDFLHFLKTSA